MTLRDLVFDTNLAAGRITGAAVDVTVTPVNGSPIETTGLWATPLQQDEPTMDAKRHERIRIMALTREAVPTLPKGSIVLAPERPDGIAVGWRVEGFEVEEVEHRRVVLVRDESADEAT